MNEKGSTLIEVVIGVVLISMVILGLFKGLSVGIWGTGSPAAPFSFTVGFTGAHTIQFKNNSSGEGAKTITTKPYIGGNDNFTWVRVRGYQDYIIKSEAKDAGGNVRATVTAYVRQTPGPSKYWVAQEVSIFSWQIQ